MKKIKLIMDCDPGLDDAVAIIMALAHPEIDLLGITTVVGNMPVEGTQQNARRICELMKRPDMGVYQGCPRVIFEDRSPFSRKDSVYSASDIHGETGLGGCKLSAPSMPVNDEHAVNFLIKTIRESPEKITISATAALTNIACALIMAPDIKSNIKHIVMMGGVMGIGNITPAAEYNFYCDPQAAHIVFTSGLPITMIGLDLTRQTQTTEEWIAEVKAIGNPVSQAVVDMLSYYHRPDAILEPGVEGGVLHDPNVIAYLLKPELYKGREVHVEIDVSHSITAGRSTVDWYEKRGLAANAFVINEVNMTGFFELLTKSIKKHS